MKINCTTTFKDTDDGRPATFHAGDTLTVSDADGARFCANGWATDITGEAATGAPATGSTDLDIQDVVSGHTATTGD
jgi:hypothetical protein